MRPVIACVRPVIACVRPVLACVRRVIITGVCEACYSVC